MAKRQMSKREKVILGLTVFVCAAALLWIGYLEKFIADYKLVDASLMTAKQTFQNQRKILAKAGLVEKAWGDIAASLPPQTGKQRPEMQFTQELAALFRQLKLSPPSIAPPEHEEVPGAEDFVYIVLPVTNVRGTLEDVARLLKGLHERSLLVQKLRIDAGGRSGDTLTVNIDVARLVQTKDLAPADQNRVIKRR